LLKRVLCPNKYIKNRCKWDTRIDLIKYQTITIGSEMESEYGKNLYKISKQKLEKCFPEFERLFERNVGKICWNGLNKEQMDILNEKIAKGILYDKTKPISLLL
jgi:hypothetical protein